MAQIVFFMMTFLVSGLIKFYNRLEDKSKSPKLIDTEEFETVIGKLELLKKQLDLIDDRINNNDLNEIDFMVNQSCNYDITHYPSNNTL